jgi:hypothetical protein
VRHEHHKRIRKGSKGTQVPQAVPVTTKARHTRQPATTESDRPDYADLSFVRGKATRYGWTSTDLFAVPEQDYGDGWITGLRAFQELQQLVKTQPQGDHDVGLAHYVQWILEAAFKAVEADRDTKGKSKRGAACAFTQCAGQFLLAMLRANDGRYMADVIDCHQKTTDYFKVRDAQQRAAFIARMQAARAAKRAAREQASTSGHHENIAVPEAAGEVAA